MIYGSGISGPVWLDNMDCTGTESSLLQCASGSPIGYANCGNANNMAGAFCHGERVLCIIVNDKKSLNWSIVQKFSLAVLSRYNNTILRLLILPARIYQPGLHLLRCIHINIRCSA